MIAVKSTEVAPTVAARGAADKCYAAGANAEVVRWAPDDARTILDVGCGSGGNAMVLTNRGVVVDGVTLSPSEAASARLWCRSVFVHDLETGLPAGVEGPYDAVLCSHVLEHVCFPARLLTDIYDVLATCGRIIVAIPNLLFYRSRAQLLLGRFEYRDGGIMDDTHFRWYTIATMTRLLETHGFIVERAYGDGSVPLGPLRRLSPTLAGIVDRWCGHVAPGLFGWQLVLVATRC